jgi:Flp pilus assembly pilin Flp
MINNIPKLNKPLFLLFSFLLLFINLNAQTWTQIGSDIDGEVKGDKSGHSVSLSSDGSTVAIGAYGNDGNGTDAGHVRIYKNVSGTWTQVGSAIDGEAAGDMSGVSVSLCSDGNTVAIGAGNNWSVGGDVRVYENINGTWTQIGSNIDTEGGVINFSDRTVSLSSNGRTVAIGAPHNDANKKYYAGYVRIYQNISGTWTQIGSDIDGDAARDNSGFSISLSSNGSIVAIGAPENASNGTDAGHVRIYKNISGTWTQLGSDIDGESAGDYSGVAVSLSSDGSTVAIGAMLNGGNGADAGHVRVYTIGTANVSEISINKDYAVYPNPTKGVVFIKAKASLLGATYTVYSSNGAEVLSGSITTEVTTLGIQDFAEGVYLISIGNDLKQTFRVIKE